MNSLGCPLNVVGWQKSQISAHAKALAGTMNTASLNLATVQGRHVVLANDFSVVNLPGTRPPAEISYHLQMVGGLWHHVM